MDRRFLFTYLLILVLFSISYQVQAQERSMTLDMNTSIEKINTYIDLLTDSNELSFWAPTHPQLCDPGMDWTVKKENNIIKYQIWWHKPFSDWEIITTSALTDTLYKYRDGIVLSFRKRKIEPTGSNGQTPDSLKPEKIDISKIAGTYSDFLTYSTYPRFTLIIKKKNKYKTIMPAPRPFVSKGIWEIHNDTLICYETHRNTNINNEEKKIKGKPIKFKFIVVGEKMYSIVEKKRVLIVKKE